MNQITLKIFINIHLNILKIIYPIFRGIYFAKYYGGGGEMAAGEKMKAYGVGKN